MPELNSLKSVDVTDSAIPPVAQSHFSLAPGDVWIASFGEYDPPFTNTTGAAEGQRGGGATMRGNGAPPATLPIEIHAPRTTAVVISVRFIDTCRSWSQPAKRTG